MSDSRSSERGRNETDKERIDRNLTELLGELRVALPGVQVLFAFLLVLPFNSGFADVTSFQRNVYLFTLLTTAFSAVLLIAPTISHRLQFRKDRKLQILRSANRLTIAGMSALAVAMCGAVVLVSDFVFGGATAAAAAGSVALASAIFWYVLPLLGRMRAEDED